MRGMAKPIACLIAGLAALGALAGDRPEALASPPLAAAPVGAGSSSSDAASAELSVAVGLRAYVDANGALSESPPGGDAERTIALPRRNYDLMWTETRPDGSVLLHTEGQVQMAAMARIGADGRIEQYCAPAARPAAATRAAASVPAADAAQ